MHKTKNLIFKISCILILVAAFVYFFAPQVAPWVMAVAVAAFTAIVASTPYPEKSLRGKRLFNFQIVACVLMVVATYLMFRHRNEWALAMIAGAIFQLYAAVVLPQELEKEKRRNNM